jgi:putative spermidine/putrescine transport system ATP-binding protein
MSLQDFRALRLDAMSRDFGSLNALKGISLEVRRGEFIALLGPSGCGKSTALNCLAGLMPLSSGSIWLDDKRIDTLGPENRGFGMVFQNYALFPHMNVRKNIGFGLKMQRRPKDEIDRRVTEAMRLVRLGPQAEKLPGQLSGGQQQRVAIARAIVVEPPLVLRCATIYVTHDQDEALSLADRIVVLRDGQMRQVGTPDELYARPAHPDVAEFMGFRNVLPTTASFDGRLSVTLGPASLWATPVGEIAPGPAMLAIRPEDLSPVQGGPIHASVLTAEYRGRDFYGVAVTAEATELYFRSEHRVATGEMLTLSAEPSRVLVYPA